MFGHNLYIIFIVRNQIFLKMDFIHIHVQIQVM